MRVWVLGSEGMLGRAFLRYLKGRVDLLATSHREVDVTQPQAIEDFAKHYQPDIWINCTGYTKVDLAQQEPELAFAINSEAPFQLGKCAAQLSKNGRKPLVIHFSTDYVFDGNQSHPYRETDNPHPINIYGKSKLEGEQRLSQAYDYCLIFRLSWLFGTQGQNFVKTMLNLMQSNEILKVVEDQIGRPTYCDDVVLASWEMLGHTGLFHLCNKESVSWHGFAQEIAHQARMLGANLKVQLIEPITSYELQRLAPRPSYSVLDTQLIESKGIHLRPWSEALHDCLNVLLEKS